MVPRSRLAVRSWCCIVATLTAGIASAQTYPIKPVRIVTSEPGGSNDFAARVVAQELSVALGQQVIVENRPAGIIPGEIVSRAAPDGYTLLFIGSSFWVGPLMQKTPYDPVKDFAPVSLVNRAPTILVVHPSLPVNSVQELIALAKRRPGELDYAMGAPGGSSHLSAELFKALTGTNIVRIPYKGNAQALNGLIGGQVQLMFAVSAAISPHVKSSRLRALATTGAQPSALAPGLPTVESAGVPGYESETMVSVFAPARTSTMIVQRLTDEIVKALARPDVKEKFFKAGVEVVGSSPDQLVATMKNDASRFGKVIKDSGIRLE